jgi:hypothetical protein
MGQGISILVFYATSKQKSQQLSWLLDNLQDVIKHVS